MHHFEYRNGEMFAEDVPVKRIAKQVGTPAYVYSLATLQRHFRVFDEAFAKIPHIVCFSVKANSNIALLRTFAKAGSGFDIVSGGELFRALKAGADPKKIEALVVSHGHFDHYGGLIGFLDKYRSVLPADLTLYAGGEDNFCPRYAGTPGSLAENGVLDRREIAKRNVKTVLAENPVLVGHAQAVREAIPATITKKPSTI